MGLYIYIYINPLLRCGLDIESTECFLLHRFPSQIAPDLLDNYPGTNQQVLR